MHAPTNNVDDPAALDLAVTNARAALPAWRAMSVSERMAVISQIRRLLVRDMETWVTVLQSEARKSPIDSLTGDLMTVLAAIRYYERSAKRILRPRKVRSPIWMGLARSFVRHEPYGVVLVVAPWNYPLQLALIPAITALAAGNTVLLKPSEKLPHVNLLLRMMLQEAGLPKGVCQVLQGDKEVVQGLIDRGPDKIFFTGGTDAGRSISRQAAAKLIPCDLELGGKDPMIVCRDANLERAARAAVWGGFMNSGQVCVGVERIYVDASVYDEFVSMAAEYTRELRQSEEEWADMGGMTTEEGWHHCRDLLEDAVAKGAVVVSGGLAKQASPPLFPPTLLTNVTPEMRLMREEIFGPILPILPFGDEEEAIRLANDSIYGLSASVFSGDRVRAMRIAERLESGSVAVNDVVLPVANMHLPFGGVKHSGMGRTHGEEGLLAFSRTKSLMISPGRLRRGMNWFPYTKQTYGLLKQAVKWLYGRDTARLRRRKPH